jgi:hypothetical protein
MNTDTKKKQFIEFYQQLCEEYGMYVGTWISESGMDNGVCVEDITQEDELEGHVKELKETS